MVESILLGGKVAFGLMGLSIGFRLRQMARSDEGLGTHGLGAGVIFVGGIGLAATAVASALVGASPTLAVALSLGGDLLERLALVGLCVFIWKVFRPESRWAPAAIVLLGLGLFASSGWELVSQAWPRYDASKPSAWGTQLSFALPFAWSAMEAAAEWSRGRRKLALGLMPHIAVVRFALWSLVCAAFVGICALAVVAPIAADAGRTSMAELLVGVRAGLYYAIAAALWIGMFEPAFYARLFASDCESPAPGSAGA